MSKSDDFDSILENGISFGRRGSNNSSDDKVKTKAKKKKYITGVIPIVGRHLAFIVFWWILGRFSFWFIDYFGIFFTGFINISLTAYISYLAATRIS